MVRLKARGRRTVVLTAALLFAGSALASVGDRLPEFQECLQVCGEVNCGENPTWIPPNRRLLLWTCPSECDYACQQIITDARRRHPPLDSSSPSSSERQQQQPTVQFHGKWPFYRYLGMQEPFSVLFSLLNFLAHDLGLSRLRETIPASYPLRKYYEVLGYFGMASWIFSMIFHTRDFALTEKLDYFAAGASVLYGLYYTPIRIFRLEKPTPRNASVVRAWTLLCVALYIAHVSYLYFWTWDYAYNMTANVVVGVIQNVLWSGFSVYRFRKLGMLWAAWPGMIVAWVIMAMSLELFDFAPLGGMVDAHSLWHLGTVVPTFWWYSFLIKDAQEDMQSLRLKA